MDPTPWPARMLDIRLKGKAEGTAARAKAGGDQIKGTHPSHPLDDYVGAFEHPAYGVLRIGRNGDQLHYDFHKMKFPLAHYHYDRFDTPDDEDEGKSSVNFQTNPQGDVDKIVMSLDEGEAIFVRRAAQVDPALLQKLAGTYVTATGFKVQAKVQDGTGVLLVVPGQADLKLLPYKGLRFHCKEFSDLEFEFVLVDGAVTALKQTDPSGVSTLTRQ